MAISDSAAAGSRAVYTGFWIDYDRGQTKGATLTLFNSHATALLAFLAIIVSYAASRSFKIWRLLWHHLMRPRPLDSNIVSRGRIRCQVILRNSESASGALISLFGSSLVWKAWSPKLLERTWKPWLLKALIFGHCLSFIALSILTSQVVVGRTVVSRNSPTCGKWDVKQLTENTSYESQKTWSMVRNEFNRNSTMDAENYVRNCYQAETARGFFDCTKFVSRSFSFSEEHNLPCPFGDGVCLMSSGPAFAMDTGNISFSALGINIKHAKDLFIRKRTTCAVIDSRRFRVKEVSLEPNQTYRVYSFGRDGSGNISLPYPTLTVRSTFDLFTQYYINFNNSIKVSQPLRPNGSTNDVSLLSLQGSGIAFFNMSDDPWFAAHNQFKPDDAYLVAIGGNDLGGIEILYTMDYFLNTIGCDERAQFCSHLTNRCTPWGGLLMESTLKSTSGTDIITILGGEVKANAQANDYLDILLAGMVFSSIMQYSSMHHSIEHRGSEALQASRFFSNAVQTRLDPEQWKLELRYWFMMGLARTQIEIFNTVEKPANLPQEWAINMWADMPSRRICGRIKFRSPNHMCLSAVGIMLIFLFTISLTILSYMDMLLASKFLRGKFTKFVSAWEQTENLALLENSKASVSCMYFSGIECSC